MNTLHTDLGGGIADDETIYRAFILSCINDGHIYSNQEFSSSRCFDCGAIHWIEDAELKQEVLSNACIIYINDDTDKRQLAFLYEAIADYVFHDIKY